MLTEEQIFKRCEEYDGRRFRIEVNRIVRKRCGGIADKALERLRRFERKEGINSEGLEYVYRLVEEIGRLANEGL